MEKCSSNDMYNLSTYILDALVFNNPGFVIALNPQNVFLACSPALELFLKIQQKHYINHPFREFLSDIHFKESIIEQIFFNINHVLTEKKPLQQIEIKYPSNSIHNAHYFLFDIFLYNIADGDQILVLQAADITSQKMEVLATKKAHAAFRKSAFQKHRYLDKILAHMPGSVYWVDEKCVFQGCNDNCASICGYKDRSEIIGKTWDDFLPIMSEDLAPSLIKNYKKDAQEIMASGVPRLNIEDPLSPKADGSLAYFLANRVPIFEDDKVIGMVGISLDITDLKKARQELEVAKEKAEIANQAKSDFLASMSHDLRTPLNGILGIAQILLTKSLGREQTEFVNNIIQAGNTLLQIIEDILNFSRIEAGKFELSIEPFNLRQLIEEIVDLVSIQANKKNIKIYHSYDENAPYYVIGDLHCTRRVIINLIDNAIKFTDSGYVLVSVESISATSEEATLQIAIEDTGIGIPSDKLNYIFERFNRLVPSYKGRYKGTGLGLTIVKQLIEALGGSIHVNSQPGKGSTFWFELPFKIQNKKVSISNWTKYYQNLSLLIIDDSDIRAEIRLKDLSSKQGQHIHGKVAMNKFKNGDLITHYDIILIDDEISDISPLKLAQIIRQNPSYKKTLLILFSKPCSLEQIDKAKKASFHSIFNKSMQPAELLNKLTFSWESWMYALLDTYKSKSQQAISILLIEDDFLSQKVTRIILEDSGCTVEVAGDGKTALSMIHKKHFLILIDIGLPDIDGVTLAEKIRNGTSPDKDTPIVALTAHVMENEIDNCIKAGMNYFMKKPLMKHELLQILLKVVPVLS